MIISRDNSLLRQARAVRDGKESELIFVEGLRLCEEALRSGVKIEAVIFSEEIEKKEKAARLLQELGAVCDRFGEVSEPLLASVSYTKTPQGVIVLAKRPPSGPTLLKAKNGKPRLLVRCKRYNPCECRRDHSHCRSFWATGVIATATRQIPSRQNRFAGAMVRVPNAVFEW